MSAAHMEMLNTVNQGKFEEYVPELVFIAAVCFLGIVGNLLLIIYMKQRKQTVSSVCLTVLSFNDLVASTFLVIGTIYDLANTYTFYNNILCKFQLLFTHVFPTNSLMLQLPIAVDRFFCIVMALSSKRFSMKAAKMTLIGIMTFSIILSLREVFIGGSVPIRISMPNNVTVTGYQCFYFEEELLQLLQFIFHSVDFALVILTIIALGILYGAVAAKLVLKRKSANTKTNDKHGEKDQNSKPLDLQDRGTHSTISDGKMNVHDRAVSNIPTTLSSDKIQARRRIQRKITIMIFVITAASVISLVPVLTIRLITEKTEAEMPIWMRILVRSYIINSSVNPYIVSLFNSDFRRFLIEKIFCRWKT